MREHPVFGDLSDQFLALREGPGITARAGHSALGDGLWLSTDPGGQAVLSCAPGEPGVALSLEGGDSGKWACLGMQLPIKALQRGRYLGLLIELAGGNVMSFTPVLRYFQEDGGFQDVPTATPVVLAGGAREHLSYIPLDADRLAGAKSCELNLFFHSDRFAVDVLRIEPLLMI